MENQSRIIFKREQLGSYSTPSAPGTYELEVAGNVTEKNLFTDEKGSRYIVNLKAIAPDKLQLVKETFKDSEALAIEQTTGLFMTASIWKAQGTSPALPMRGEKVKCTVDFVESRDGSQTLRVTNINVQPAKTAARLNVASFFAEVVQTADVVHN